MFKRTQRLPKEIDQASTFLWGSLYCAGLAIFSEYKSRGAFPTLSGAITLLIVAAVYVVLTIFIERGKNWARLTYFVLIIAGLPICIPLVIVAFSANAVLGIIIGISYTLPFLAFWLLFTRPGSDWFKRDSRLTSANISVRLRELDNLHSQGLISDAERAKKREQILSEI